VIGTALAHDRIAAAIGAGVAKLAREVRATQEIS